MAPNAAFEWEVSTKRTDEIPAIMLEIEEPPKGGLSPKKNDNPLRVWSFVVVESKRKALWGISRATEL